MFTMQMPFTCQRIFRHNSHEKYWMKTIATRSMNPGMNKLKQNIKFFFDSFIVALKTSHIYKVCFLCRFISLNAFELNKTNYF